MQRQRGQLLGFGGCVSDPVWAKVPETQNSFFFSIPRNHPPRKELDHLYSTAGSFPTGPPTQPQNKCFTMVLSKQSIPTRTTPALLLDFFHPTNARPPLPACTGAGAVTDTTGRTGGAKAEPVVGAALALPTPPRCEAVTAGRLGRTRCSAPGLTWSLGPPGRPKSRNRFSITGVAFSAALRMCLDDQPETNGWNSPDNHLLCKGSQANHLGTTCFLLELGFQVFVCVCVIHSNPSIYQGLPTNRSAPIDA